MKIKVYDGTREDRHLCLTCSKSMIIKGTVESQEIHLCRRETSEDYSVPPREITFKVAECSGYAQKDASYMPEMRQKATYLFQLPSHRWVGLTVGQANDYHFMEALRKKDREDNKIKDEHKEDIDKVLKARS